MTTHDATFPDATEREVDRLNALVEVLTEKAKARSMCGYCLSGPFQWGEELQGHIQACAKHPLATLRAEVERLKAALFNSDTAYDFAVTALKDAQLIAVSDELRRRSARNQSEAAEARRELQAIAVIAAGRVYAGHNDTCGAVLSTEPYPCSCGHDALDAATAKAIQGGK